MADPKPGGHGHHANDYRPDPTRADRIRGDKDSSGISSGGRGGKNGHVRGGGGHVGQSPSHLQHQQHLQQQQQQQQQRNIRGQIVVALYTYQGSECGDMSFQKGDQMEILDDT